MPSLIDTVRNLPDTIATAVAGKINSMIEILTTSVKTAIVKNSDDLIKTGLKAISDYLNKLIDKNSKVPIPNISPEFLGKKSAKYLITILQAYNATANKPEVVEVFTQNYQNDTGRFCKNVLRLLDGYIKYYDTLKKAKSFRELLSFKKGLMEYFENLKKFAEDYQAKDYTFDNLSKQYVEKVKKEAGGNNAEGGEVDEKQLPISISSSTAENYGLVGDFVNIFFIPILTASINNLNDNDYNNCAIYIGDRAEQGFKLNYEKLGLTDRRAVVDPKLGTSEYVKKDEKLSEQISASNPKIIKKCKKETNDLLEKAIKLHDDIVKQYFSYMVSPKFVPQTAVKTILDETHKKIYKMEATECNCSSQNKPHMPTAPIVKEYNTNKEKCAMVDLKLLIDKEENVANAEQISDQMKSCYNSVVENLKGQTLKQNLDAMKYASKHITELDPKKEKYKESWKSYLQTLLWSKKYDPTSINILLNTFYNLLNSCTINSDIKENEKKLKNLDSYIKNIYQAHLLFLTLEKNVGKIDSMLKNISEEGVKQAFPRECTGRCAKDIMILCDAKQPNLESSKNTLSTIQTAIDQTAKISKQLGEFNKKYDEFKSLVKTVIVAPRVSERIQELDNAIKAGIKELSIIKDESTMIRNLEALTIDLKRYLKDVQSLSSDVVGKSKLKHFFKKVKDKLSSH